MFNILHLHASHDKAYREAEKYIILILCIMIKHREKLL